MTRQTGSDHAGGSGVDVNSASETATLDVPGRPDSIRVLVQNATGTFDVTIEFSNTSITINGDSSTDVYEERAVMDGSSVTVTISDTSGAANTVDYDILLV